jgi:hypothetical protein
LDQYFKVGAVDESNKRFYELLLIIGLIGLSLMLLAQEVQQLQLYLFIIGGLNCKKGTRCIKNL